MGQAPRPPARPLRGEAVAARPLLLLDVDGVLSPTGSGVPPGYERRTTPAYDVVIRPQHGEWLRSLLPLFEIVWATTWGESANDVFGAIHELPRLPAIAIPRDLPREGTRKLATVAAYAGERPLAWVEDELYEDAEAWSASRTAPTLLRRTRGSIGLTSEDVAALTAFAGA